MKNITLIILKDWIFIIISSPNKCIFWYLNSYLIKKNGKDKKWISINLLIYQQADG